MRSHAGHQSRCCKEWLWKEYFKDPLQWWDNRWSKSSPVVPDFKHKRIKASLWLDAPLTPTWVHEELRRRGLATAPGKLTLEEKKKKEEGTIPDCPIPILESPHHFSAEIPAFLSSLRSCSKQKDLHAGIQVHAAIVKHGLLERSSYVANTLLNMYAKCGDLLQAQHVFEEIPVQNVVSWSALIAGYTQHGQGRIALDCYHRMRCAGISADAVTYTCILKACSCIGAVDMGEQIHDEAARQGLLQRDLVLGNAVVDMYAKSGEFAKAKNVLENLFVRDVVTWSALIAGYAQFGQGQEALVCFQRMQGEGLSPDAVTFICVLRACGSLGALDKGELIHKEIMKLELLKDNIVVGNTLVDMYIRCRALPKARQVLEELPLRDVVSWNTVIGGYAEQGHHKEALNCYERMQTEGYAPNAVTYISALKACSGLGSVDKGKQIHDEIARQGLLQDDIVLGTVLVDMYAKCGALPKAHQLLEDLPAGDGVLWSAIITGYAQQGHYEKAVKCFEQMQKNGFSPDAVTLSCVLNACSHSGLVQRGELYFTSMGTKYGITPSFEHYTCMVDLYGRSGHFDKAKELIERMPSSGCLTVWYALLGACQKWGEVSVGRWAFEHAVQADGADAATYVCMANIYTAAGLHEEAENVTRVGLREVILKPEPDLGATVDTSAVGESAHASSMCMGIS